MSKAHNLLFVMLGGLFWLVGMLIVRSVGSAAFSEGNPRLGWMYVLAIPIMLASMYLVTLLSRLGWRQLLRPMVVMTFTATFLDGLALAWSRTWYHVSFEVALHGAAWILWAAGWGLLLAYAFDKGEAPGLHQP